MLTIEDRKSYIENRVCVSCNNQYSSILTPNPIKDSDKSRTNIIS